MEKRMEEGWNPLGDEDALLNKLKEQGDGFEVPVNYFTSLQNEVLEKIEADRSTTWKYKIQQVLIWVDLRILSQPVYRLAILFGFVLGISFLVFPTHTSSVAEANEIPKEDIQQYVLSHIEDFETDLISAFLEEPNLSSDFSIGKSQNNNELDTVLEDIIEDIDLEDLEDFL